MGWVAIPSLARSGEAGMRRRAQSRRKQIHVRGDGDEREITAFVCSFWVIRDMEIVNIPFCRRGKASFICFARSVAAGRSTMKLMVAP
jgi:hypothetical protein